MAASPSAFSTLAQRIESDLEARLGPRHAIRFALPQPRSYERIPSGIPAIDRLTGGGIPRGTLSEIHGRASSGRTSLLYSLLARSTSRQEYCALIDASDTFDPQSAMAAGVHLPRLLWIRCGGNAEHALKSADLIVQGAGFGLVAMDLADVPLIQASRISLASWFRLRHAVERTSAALVVLAQQTLAKSCSALQLELRGEESIWQGEQYGKLLTGMRAQAESQKHHRTQAQEFELWR